MLQGLFLLVDLTWQTSSSFLPSKGSFLLRANPFQAGRVVVECGVKSPASSSCGTEVLRNSKLAVQKKGIAEGIASGVDSWQRGGPQMVNNLFVVLVP